MMRARTVFGEPIASHYEAWYETPQGRHADALEKASLDRLLGRFSEARSVLEVGCGTGHFTRWFEEQGLMAVGLDISAPMLSQARAGLAPNGTPLVQADAYRLPFADDAFDLAAFITTIEFLEASQEALAEAARVASRGLLLGVLNRWSVLAFRRRVAGLFHRSVYKTAHFYGVGELKRLLRSLVRDAPAKDAKWHRPSGGCSRISWHTALFPRWLPWQPTRLPWGGFIAVALSLPEAG
jgi:ubiquinone/menaquinone biosynthesis C-methylase UbiE